MNKEIKIFNNFIGSSLYHVAGYIGLAAILNIGFNVFWWLRFGEWTNDCIAIWLRMISINIPKLNTEWVMIDKFFNYLIFELHTSLFLIGCAVILFLIAEKLENNSRD